MLFVLSAADVTALTGRVRYSAQAKVLKGLGIKFLTRPDGSLAVLKAAVDAALSPETQEVRALARAAADGPNWTKLPSRRRPAGQ